MWLKKIAETPLNTFARVIDSLTSASADEQKINAPSINAVNDALKNKVDVSDMDANFETFNNTIAELDGKKVDKTGLSFVNGYVSITGGVMAGFNTATINLDTSKAFVALNALHATVSSYAIPLIVTQVTGTAGKLSITYYSEKTHEGGLGDRLEYFITVVNK